jgi:hypothetical protein
MREWRQFAGKHASLSYLEYVNSQSEEVRVTHQTLIDEREQKGN